MTQKHNVGGEIVSALESAWRAVQTNHPEIPDVVIIVGRGKTRSHGRQLFGYHAAERWSVQNDGPQLTEIFIGGEGLNRGAEAVIGTLIHEAAHVLAQVRKIKDTSQRGRYHNKRFKALGEELGLVIDFDKRIGWSPTTVPAETAERYKQSIAELEGAITAVRRFDAAGPSTPSRTPPPARCSCGRQIRVAPSVLAQAPIVCGACDGLFVIVDLSTTAGSDVPSNVDGPHSVASDN